VQHLQHGQRIVTGQAVIDVFAFAARVHQALLAQHTQLLRQCRLADAQIQFQFTDAELTLPHAAQQHQAIGMGQRLEQRTGLLC